MKHNCFYGYMKTYKLSFRELPSSDKFLHISVNCRGAVARFSLSVLCKPLVIAKSPAI